MSKVLSYEKFLNHDNFYTQEELINQFGSPVSSSFTSSLVIKNEDLFLEYKNEDLISVSEEKKVSKKLIHDILSDEGMFRYIQTNLNNSSGVVLKIDYMMDANPVSSITLTKAELITAINQIMNDLSQKEKMRFAFIESISRTYSCEQKYNDYTHEVFVDGLKLGIPASTLLKIITCDEETFNNFLNGSINFGYDKECLAFALVDFVARERIFEKFEFKASTIQRFNKIRDFSLIDFESLNQNRSKNDIGRNGESVLEKINLSDELMAYLDKEMDKTYSKFEKSVYYYLKLCEALTYDANYFLSSSPELLENHENTEYINSISTTNNEITKYDFTMIFASILSKLQIDFTLDQNLVAGINSNAPMLTFRYGEYLISLTSFENPDRSDLLNVKINDEIINLTCINKNEFTRNKFKELLNRIYSNITREKANAKAFKESLENYNSRNNINEVSIQEKLRILLLEINRTNLKGIDAIGYVKKIIQNIFSNTNRVKLNYLCKESKRNYLTPVTIISVLNDDGYVYYMIDHTNPNGVMELSKEQVTSVLGLGGMYYIDDNRIPGINNFVGEKYVR
ncbi:MAG: hypothetical protein J1F35_07215 [Erysipelotrichales bacterium]|nr:hypothetical protein [Erysipelotrichales bacterium]